VKQEGFEIQSRGQKATPYVWTRHRRGASLKESPLELNAVGVTGGLPATKGQIKKFGLNSFGGPKYGGHKVPVILLKIGPGQVRQADLDREVGRQQSTEGLGAKARGGVIVYLWADTISHSSPSLKNGGGKGKTNKVRCQSKPARESGKGEKENKPSAKASVQR